MTIPTIPLPPYDAPFLPVPNITPFTYRDGVTMLKKLDLMVKYINRELVPFVNENYSELAQAFQDQVNLLIAQVNAALAAQTEDVDQKIADLETYVNNAVQSIIDNSLTVNDPMVAEMFADDESATRVEADKHYAPKDATATAISNLQTADSNLASYVNDIDGRVTTAEADITALETGKADNTALAAVQSDVDALELEVDANKADADSKWAQVPEIALDVKRGALYDVGLFNYLRNGILNNSQDTRVVVMGDSHAAGGYSAHSEQDLVKRLAARCGDLSVTQLSTVSGNPGNQGMAWYNGAVGGADSNGYIDPTSLAKVIAVVPKYVLHVIGSNDQANNVSPATFRANVLSKVTAIEAAVPGVINVLVHVHQAAYFTPTIPWSLYGDQMASIAADSPSNRVYIDANEGFTALGMPANRAGLFTNDLSHLNSVGNRWMADVIGGIMGIPSESDFADRQQDYPVTITGGTYNADAFISNVTTIKAANYPRWLRVEASVFLTDAGNNTEIWVSRTSTPAEIRKFRAAKTGDAHIQISTTMYVASGVDAVFVIAISPNGIVAVSPFAEYTRATAFTIPA